MADTVTVLGSTGSIGVQSLSVCRNLNLRVGALTAGRNAALLEEQARRFRPERVVLADPAGYPALKRALADTDIQVSAGAEAVCEAASLAGSLVVNAIVGIAGLRPSLAALRVGNRLALSNKESLVTGGHLVMEAARAGQVIPVDSEHSAIFQCLRAGRREDLRKVILTASGGPFRGKLREELADVTVTEALAHPNWSMGAKITVDSATLMNKGLEFIEAMWLFDLAPEQIEVVVHPQSVVHSAVEFNDGAVIAQMGVPDMRGAIQYALTCPERKTVGGEPLSLLRYGSLTFEEPDLATFTCLDTCIRAARAGGLVPCIANGANEMAVELFLKGKISFLEIGELVRGAVDTVKPPEDAGIAGVEEADRLARAYVLQTARPKAVR